MYQPAPQPQPRPTYQAAQSRPQMYAPAASRTEQPVYQQRTATPVHAEERPSREAPKSSGFNGFNIFGRPKPAAREEEWDERPEVNTRAITQTQPLFGDEFDDEIEIPTFLRKQAN
jgi:cell division protein FtsZ